MTQSAPPNITGKYTSLPKDVQNLITDLSTAIELQQSSPNGLLPETLFRVDDCVYEVAKKTITKVTNFSNSNRRDILWKIFRDVDDSNKLKKAKAMLQKLLSSMDKELFYKLITISGSEQNSITMAIEGATKDTLAMLNLGEQSYADYI